MAIYFKSFSGDISSISLSLISEYSEYSESVWNYIISIIALENNCDNSQVVIFENEKDIYNQHEPELIVDKQYNFFIRDAEDNYSVNVSYYIENIKDVDNASITYNKISISIYDIQKILKKTFNIYQQNGINIYYHENDVIKKESSIKIKNQDGLFSFYSVLYEKADLSVSWYEKNYIISKIMRQYNQIEEYNRIYEEDWNSFVGDDLE